MIDSSYDENLNENPFFQELKTEYADLLKKSIRENWIICIPRVDSFQKSSITEEDFLTHVLVPNDELPLSHYRTLSGKLVVVENKVITLEEDDLVSSVSVHIIFEETFYTENFQKYKVWCIECPLTKSAIQYFDHNTNNIVTTLRDCIDLLWTEGLGKALLEQLDSTIEDFLQKNSLEKADLPTIKESCSTLYNKCFQIVLENSRLRERTLRSKFLLENVKISVETYMQHGIYQKLFSSISSCTAIEDSIFNKIVRNFYDIQLRDLNINADFHEAIPCAKRELVKINGYSTVLGKLGCLRHTLTEVSKFHSIVTVDDLLPIFVFIILKISIPNWISNLIFLKQFRFSFASTVDESNFLITTLEAAVEYIKSGTLQGPSEPESDSFAAPEEKSDEKCNSISFLFEQIRIGNYDMVKSILKKNLSDSKTNINELCHPLCSCDKCEKLMSQNVYKMMPTVNSCDDRGFTALHVACMYGKPKLVEFLLENQANVECSDYSGATPLHYAAMRGHQNALLLLLHSGANINALDNEKSTALHFACNNGHETCVKALLYFSEHEIIPININSCNGLGNTPLHYASRWGYESIVQILIEYGADPHIENKHKKTSLDYALNVNIYHIMNETKRCIKKREILTATEDLKTDLDFEKLERTTSEKVQGVKPTSTREIKKVDLLLRAVVYADIPLICYYLGIPLSTESNTENLCHPLCNCENCESFQNDQQSGETQDINVCNSEGFTPLHTACFHGKTQVVKLLISNKASVNIITRKGLSPLHLACQTQRYEIVKFLLNTKKCDVNLQDGRGNTPLHFACAANDLRIVDQLMKYGANPKLRNSKGVSPLEEAEEKLYFGLIKIMKEKQ